MKKNGLVLDHNKVIISKAAQVKIVVNKALSHHG